MSIEELKQLQTEIIKKNKTCNIIGFIIFIFAVVIYLTISIPKNTDIYLMIIIIVIELIFTLIITTFIKNKVNGKDINKFYKEFKNIFVLKSLQNIFEGITYYPEKGFSKKFIESVGMLDTGDSYESNDYISGKYKNILFEQSDIHIQEEHEEEDADGNKETVWETTFLGRVMIFDFNKKFKANIQVASYYFDANSLPWSKKFTRVKMEDIEFNKTFNVYAESEHEAFYILTPHFMEKLKDITKKIKCGVMFCFVDNRLHIAVDNNKDSFEYNVFKPINEQQIEENISNDIKLITNFVDELNLDNDLFRREV